MSIYRVLSCVVGRECLGVQYATGDQWGKNSKKNEEMEPKKKQHPVVDVTGDRSKVRCCNEQYCLGTWNVKSRNQGKFEVIKQEMAKVNVDILGIRELKWTGMGEFNSEDHYVQCQPYSRPPLTHTSARDSWTLMGKSGSISCVVTVPFSWVLVHTRFCLCPPRVCFPSPV